MGRLYKGARRSVRGLRFRRDTYGYEGMCERLAQVRKGVRGCMKVRDVCVRGVAWIRKGARV